MKVRAIIIISTLLFGLSLSDTFAATATINPIIDNTIAEDFPDNSSGDCNSIFSGNTDNGFARRALLQFDIAAAIPPGSTINSVTLTMHITRGGNHSDAVMTLHSVNLAWAEAAAGVTPNGCGTRGGGQGEPAVNGAATWLSAMHNQTLWSSPGGDFSAASASTFVNSTTPVWDSAAVGNGAMVNDVQNWLDDPATNHGWILIGDEANSPTTRRFDSSEGSAPPALVVNFTTTAAVEACCQTDGTCSLTIVGSSDCTGTVLSGVDSCEPNQCPQPTGACCNVDETCSDSIDRLVCENAGGTFQGGNSSCGQGNVNCGLAPFVEPLPIPPVLQPTGTRADGVPQYTISVQPATQIVHPDLPATSLWTYNGMWPGPTIVAGKDQPIEITYQNNLPATSGGKRGNNLLEVDTCAHGPNYYGDSKRIVTHLHGGHVPARVDGQPELTILPGEIDTYEYPNNQEAATTWYHDHALGITRLNVYGGMAGFYLIADSEDTLDANNAFGLPSGEYEIGLAIQDRTFNPDGSLFYNAQLEDAFKGNKIVVNGKVWPYLNVKQGKYRFRILNGSQSREYIFRLENITDPGNDPVFTLVGTDLGLLSAPTNLGSVFGRISPAERLDVVIDFSGFPAGTEIVFRNDEQTPPLLPNIMKFIVTNQIGYTGTISPVLRPVTPLDTQGVPVRYFRLTKETLPCSNDPGRTVNEWHVESLDGPGGNVLGKKWDDLNDFPVLGTREIWEFENPTNSMHPMHVHLVRFQIVSKETLGGQPISMKPWEVNTWKDTVRVPPNSRVRVIMDFKDYPGRFPAHCHILDHEDHEMMRQYQTMNDPAYAVIDGICSEHEDCMSNPADCPVLGGALCGNGLCEAGDGENCITCPGDCAGKQSGAASKMFCCGDATAGNPTNPIGCGVDINDNRCINSGNNLFCRLDPRLTACCGDKLCEGQETAANCPLDCATCIPTGVSETICNNIDDDCDYLVDEDYATSPTTCGIGACASTGEMLCQAGSVVDTCTPGTPQTEVCDGIDNNCDGQIDDGNPEGGSACSTGLLGECAAGTTECQGGTLQCTANNQPQAEVCDGLDNNCDGQVDEGVTITYYRDADGDGFGNALDTTQACSPPAGYVVDNTDCDDTEPEVYPGGPPVRVVGLSTTYYTGLQAGYNAASDTDMIFIKAETLNEIIDFNHVNNISVTINAGYDCGYTSNAGGVTIVNGGITTNAGTVTIESGTLEVQ